MGFNSGFKGLNCGLSDRHDIWGGPHGCNVTYACYFGWETPWNDAMHKSTNMNLLKTKIKFLFCLVLPGFRMSTAFWMFLPRLRPFDLLLGAACRWRWDDTDRGKPKYSEWNGSPCLVSTKIAPWTSLGSKTGLRGERPLINLPS